MLLNVGAIFMGTALTIRDLIGERAIFLREQAVGLSTSAYLLAKVCVFAAFAVMQSAIVVAINVSGRVGPGAVTSGAVIPPRTLELYIDMAARCVAAAMLAWRSRRWRSPTSRSCRCWWSRSCRSWCSRAA